MRVVNHDKIQTAPRMEEHGRGFPPAGGVCVARRGKTQASWVNGHQTAGRGTTPRAPGLRQTLVSPGASRARVSISQSPCGQIVSRISVGECVRQRMEVGHPTENCRFVCGREAGPRARVALKVT